MDKVGNIIECVQSFERGLFERHTLLIPSRFTNEAVSRLVSETSTETEESSQTMPIYEPNEDIFLSLVHVAIKIRTDLKEMSGHEGLKVSDAISCVPNSLYLFLQLLFGGEQLFEDETQDEKDTEMRRKVLSCAQDIV